MKERIYVYLFRVVLKIFFEVRKQKILYYKRNKILPFFETRGVL